MALSKNQSGLAAELYVAAELTRLEYDVTITFGNTKAIDLLVHRDDCVFAVQVKGIQETKSQCWNLDKTKFDGKNLIMVLVNLHANDKEAKPEFFVLTHNDVHELFKDTPKKGNKRTYLRYSVVRDKNIFKNRWELFNKKDNALSID